MARLATGAANSMLGAAFTGTQYLSLHTADPGTTGGSEVTGGSYARQSITWNAASSGTQTSSNAQNFTGMPATTIGYFGIWSASTAGTYLGGGTVGGVTTVPSGSTVAFASAAVSLTVS